jgi:sugar O-acyltransferase (sialic acid O-acetyltransferase NeuD family)
MTDHGRQNIVIIGAGGHGSELGSYIQDIKAECKPVELVGFIDENRSPGAWGDAKILGGFKELEAMLERGDSSALHYITAVGDNRIRSELVKKIEGIKAGRLSAWTLIHPHSTAGRSVEIGEGTCLAPGSIITTRVHVGRHCILNVNASISHDCQVEDFCNINPGAVIAGNVRLGTGCYIGAGATVINKVSIGDWAIIGAGAVVINDIPPGATAVGVPAKVIKQNA